MGFANRISSIMRELAAILYNLTVGIFKGLHEQAVETLESELSDLESAFLTIIFGALVGMPLMPIGIAVELLPLLRDELPLMEKRHFLGADVLAEYFSRLGGEW